MKKKHLLIYLLAIIAGTFLTVAIWNKAKKTPPTIPPQPEEPTSPANIEKIPDETFHSREFTSITILDQDTFIAVDRQSKKLVKFHIPSKTREELIQKPVEKYSLSYPFLFVEPNPQVINLNTKISYPINFNLISPFSSPTISPEAKLAILGNISATRHASDVFILDHTAEDIITVKKNTTATLIYWLDKNRLILQTTSEAPDNGLLEVIDTNGKTIFNINNINSFDVSPSKNQIAAAALESISLIDITTNSKTNIPIPKNSKIKWIDDQNILLLVPDKNGTRLSLLNVFTLETEPSEPLRFNNNPVFIVGVIGVANNHIFAINNEGFLLRIKFPSRF